MEGEIDWYDNKTPVKDLKVSELESICLQCVEQKRAYSSKKKEADLEKEKLDELQGKILAFLKESNLTSFRSSHGLFSVIKRFSVKTPKTEETKKKLFKYLQDRDIFYSMVNVNSRTLNGWYKEELESAVERGDGSFSVPGLDVPTYSETLSIRRK